MRTKIYIVLWGEGTPFKDRFKAAKFFREQFNISHRLSRWRSWGGEENCIFLKETDMGYPWVKLYRGNLQNIVCSFGPTYDFIVLSKNRKLIGTL